MASDCDDVGNMAGEFHANKRSGSDCDFDGTKYGVMLSYSEYKISSKLESIGTDVEGLKMSETLSTNFSISFVDIFENVDSDVVKFKIVCNGAVSNDCDDVANIAGVFDINCDFDVTNDGMMYSYFVDKLASIFESTETDLEDLRMSEIFSESTSGNMRTPFSISFADIFEIVDS